MKFKLIAIGLIVVLALSLIACSTNEPGTVSWEVPIDNFMNKPDHSDQIEVPVGDTLILKLGSNPTTGFEWSENADIDNGSMIKQVSHEFIGPDNDPPPPPGTPGQEVWEFEALKKGTATISMTYDRPWEGGEKAEWTYEITVTVN